MLKIGSTLYEPFVTSFYGVYLVTGCKYLNTAPLGVLKLSVLYTLAVFSCKYVHPRMVSRN